jgi:hypothetical protein
MPPPPTTAKSDRVMVACEILTVAVPVLRTDTVCVAVLPTATFPKRKLLALGERTLASGSPLGGSPAVV